MFFILRWLAGEGGGVFWVSPGGGLGVSRRDAEGAEFGRKQEGGLAEEWRRKRRVRGSRKGAKGAELGREHYVDKDWGLAEAQRTRGELDLGLGGLAEAEEEKKS